MPELNVEHAVKPRYGTFTEYNLSYAYNITPTARVTPMPCETSSYVDLLSANVVAANGSTYSTDDFYTDWLADVAVFSIYDPSNARSAWYLDCGNIGYMYAAYGLLPSNYSGYEFVSMNRLWSFGNWNRFLLYNIVGGEYVPIGSALNLTNSGNRAPIYYDVTLRNPSTGDTVNATGSSSSYQMSNSPTGTTICLYQPYSTFASRGDMKGQIVMTETPI